MRKIEPLRTAASLHHVGRGNPWFPRQPLPLVAAWPLAVGLSAAMSAFGRERTCTRIPSTSRCLAKNLYVSAQEGSQPPARIRLTQPVTTLQGGPPSSLAQQPASLPSYAQVAPCTWSA